MEKKIIIQLPSTPHILKLLQKFDIRVLLFKTSSNSTYIVVPNFIRFQKTSSSLVLYSQNENMVEAVGRRILTFINSQNLSYTKKLFLRGLGFRISFSSDNKRLIFKVGRSFLISILIDPELKIKLEKNQISVEGRSKVLVGNFVYRIKRLKTPDCYKGKGFWSKYENIKLKKLKKK